jgi:hypothetical protein
MGPRHPNYNDIVRLMKKMKRRKLKIEEIEDKHQNKDKYKDEAIHSAINKIFNF